MSLIFYVQRNFMYPYMILKEDIRLLFQNALDHNHIYKFNRDVSELLFISTTWGKMTLATMFPNKEFGTIDSMSKIIRNSF